MLWCMDVNFVMGGIGDVVCAVGFNFAMGAVGRDSVEEG